MDREDNVMSLEEALAKVRGQKLTAVQFIHDYVQFGFESGNLGAGLSAYAHPTIRVAGHELDWSSPLFRHELCLRINRAVVDTWVDEQQISIGFDDGGLLIVPIRGPNSEGLESFELRVEGIKTVWVG